MRHFYSGIVVGLALLASACAPGPLGTKRYDPYTGQDAAVVYTQLNDNIKDWFTFSVLPKKVIAIKIRNLFISAITLWPAKFTVFTKADSARNSTGLSM